MSPDTARAIQLLKLRHRACRRRRIRPSSTELTQIATKMEGMYGAGTYCNGEGDAKQCRQLGELEDVLRSSRDYDEQLDAWQGWHTIAAADAQGLHALRRAGQRRRARHGLRRHRRDVALRLRHDAGAKSPPKPTACGARSSRCTNSCIATRARKLEAKYGDDSGQVAGGMLPAHLMGNMWQQDWGNLWDILQPYTERRRPRHHRRAGDGSTRPTFDAQLAKHRRRPTADELVADRARRQARHGQADDRARAGLLHLARHAEAAGELLGARRSSSSRATATWSATPAPGT